jgi:hypothetical protein
MKLYLISQDENTQYDTYDSAVVVAESEEDARTIIPSYAGDKVRRIPDKEAKWTWVNDPLKVRVQYIGEADPAFLKAGTICSSFNAG